MSFKPGTILTRKTPFTPPEPDTDAPDLTPYNTVEVIGPTPVETIRDAEWAGQSGDKLSIKPASGEFAPVIDRPFGELQRDYDVQSIPPPATLDRSEVVEIEPGPSPEEVFAAASGPTPDPPRPVQPGPNAPSPEDVFATS